MNDEYTEKLTHRGELKVQKKTWCIQYYFPGPDRRYNGTFVQIDGNNIDRYISALRKNFEKYLALNKSVQSNTPIALKGDMGMTIIIGGRLTGVGLASYHMLINSESELEKIIKEFKAAEIRAKEIQAMLKSSGIF
jgi:hypothetical protein